MFLSDHLFSGGLYGRMVGRLLVDQFGVQTDKYWAWMDPGTDIGYWDLYRVLRLV